MTSATVPQHSMADPAIQVYTAPAPRNPCLTARVAIIVIRAYQRYLSPYKGFRCAHNVLHGEGSCSTYGRRAFAEHDFLDACRRLRERFQACKAAASALAMATPEAPDTVEKPEQGRKHASPDLCNRCVIDGIGELPCYALDCACSI